MKVSTIVIWFLLSFCLIIFFISPTKAQIIPGLEVNEKIYNHHNIPKFRNGNLEFSPVFLDGKIVGLVASERGLNNQIDSRDRSEIISSKAKRIINQMSLYTQEKKELPLSTLEQQLRNHLEIEPANLSGSLVILVSFPKNTPPTNLITITQADIQKFGVSEEKILEESSEYVENILINTWKERQPDYLLQQTQKSVKVIFLIFCLNLFFFCLNIFFTSKFYKKYISPKKFFIINQLSLDHKQDIKNFISGIIFRGQILVSVIGFAYISSLFYFSRSLANWILGVSLNQKFAPLDWLLTLGREATLGLPLMLLLLIIGLSLVDSASDITIDYLINVWLKKQITLPNYSERYTLRASTFAKALKWLVSVIIYLIIVILILRQLGALSNTVTVILGVVSLGVSLGAQNLIKDFINGFLILFEDQYAVGDWIAIDNLEGNVENINLRMTQLRNLEGELITIPNGSIGRVRNMSNGWSRVRFELEVNYNSDVDHVMDVMKQIACEMYEDPNWQELLLEPPEMLGVNNLAHTGIRILILIKTKPLQQWPVAREYRRRLKQVFDEQDINIGIPQQVIFVNHK